MPHAAKAEFPVTILPHLSTQSSPPPSGSATPQQPTSHVPSPQRWLPGSKEGPAHLSSPLFSPPHLVLNTRLCEAGSPLIT